MASLLPLELYDEFISYLWDDTKSLSACSLAGRALTVASQKRLFYRIILGGGEITILPEDDPGGTSSAFHKLLKSSPHIANYVQCLQIFDIDQSDSDSSDDEDEYLGYGWLPRDPFLPLFSPLLCNLKAFVLFYAPDWDLLSEKVRCSLQDLIRLPSLVYIDIAPGPIWRESFGDNLKHLILRGESGGSATSLIQPEPSRSSPIYLETFFMAEADQTFLTRLTATSDLDFRFKTSQLRKLLLDIQTNNTFQHFAIGPLLYSCRETLEEFTFIPSINFLSKGDVLDLSQMTALKTLTLCFITFPRIVERDPLRCFNNLLLLSASSTCRQLEDITFFMELDGGILRFTDWDEIFQVFVNPSCCPRLRKLSIRVLRSAYFEESVSGLLDNSEGIQKLRARPGMEVVTTEVDKTSMQVIHGIYSPDKRWDNIAF